MEDEELRELQEELSSLRKLIESPGWVWLMKIADAQVKNRFTLIIRSAAEGIDEMIRKEYAGGECAGIELFQRLPEVRIAELKETIAEVLKRRQGENSDG